MGETRRVFCNHMFKTRINLHSRTKTRGKKRLEYLIRKIINHFPAKTRNPRKLALRTPFLRSYGAHAALYSHVACSFSC